MNYDLPDLKRDYLNIRAPGHIATRIKAEVAEQNLHRQYWRPALISISLIVVAVIVIPRLLEQISSKEAGPKPISFAVLSSVAAIKAPAQTPSLSDIKSYGLPALPLRPTLSKNNKARTQLETDDNLMKEKEDV